MFLDRMVFLMLLFSSLYERTLAPWGEMAKPERGLEVFCIACDVVFLRQIITKVRVWRVFCSTYNYESMFYNRKRANIY